MKPIFRLTTNRMGEVGIKYAFGNAVTFWYPCWMNAVMLRAWNVGCDAFQAISAARYTQLDEQMCAEAAKAIKLAQVEGIDIGVFAEYLPKGINEPF